MERASVLAMYEAPRYSGAAEAKGRFQRPEPEAARDRRCDGRVTKLASTHAMHLSGLARGKPALTAGKTAATIHATLLVSATHTSTAAA